MHMSSWCRFNRVKGVVTRKDLLGYKLDEAVQVSCSCIPHTARLNAREFCN